jgi:hypothetical protein
VNPHDEEVLRESIKLATAVRADLEALMQSRRSFTPEEGHDLGRVIEILRGLERDTQTLSRPRGE